MEDHVLQLVRKAFQPLDQGRVHLIGHFETTSPLESSSHGKCRGYGYKPLRCLVRGKRDRDVTTSDALVTRSEERLRIKGNFRRLRRFVCEQRRVVV